MESNNAQKEVNAALAELKENLLKYIEQIEGQLPIYTEENISLFKQQAEKYKTEYEEISDSLQNMIVLRNAMRENYEADVLEGADPEELKEVIDLQSKFIDLHSLLKHYLEQILF